MQGFSHSSLRSRQCWMMAPWVNKVELIHSKIVIGALGDFSQLREPARCAARIGQAFSDATHTINIQPEWESEMPDIKGNNRVFSDGCGTISKNLLSIIWQEFAKTGRRHATVLQIRYRGTSIGCSHVVQARDEIFC